VIAGKDRDELMAGLAAVAAAPEAGAESVPRTVTAPVPGAAGGAGKAVFVFPGQGAHWAAVEAGDLAGLAGAGQAR